jgi:hypothetical protein
LDQVTEVRGFYDGAGNDKVRFMPSRRGQWKDITVSSAAELDKKEGAFTAGPPSPGNHGPVRVARKYHFDCAGGTPDRQMGTTCYAWVHQPLAIQKQTLHTLAGSPFNKLRMCLFPKRTMSAVRTRGDSWLGGADGREDFHIVLDSFRRAAVGELVFVERTGGGFGGP